MKFSVEDLERLRNALLRARNQAPTVTEQDGYSFLLSRIEKQLKQQCDPFETHKRDIRESQMRYRRQFGE